jgi:dissimilatory sulfite reductase (desulfoviridin) alpha/beta subunit
MPAYIPHVGGNTADGEVVYGARLKVRLPAKRVPDAVERWLRMYEAERLNDSEDFIAFTERVGTGRFEEEIKEIALPAEFNLDNLLEFIDWNRRDPYKVERGEGECAV